MQLRNAQIPSSKTKKKNSILPLRHPKKRGGKTKKKKKEQVQRFGNLTEEFDFPSHDHQKNPAQITIIIIIINYDNNKDRYDILP